MSYFSIHKILMFFAFILALSAGQAQAREKKVYDDNKTDAPIVLELFTTSDCTACVYADRMLYDAMKDKNVIALSCKIKNSDALMAPEEHDKSEKLRQAERDMINKGDDSSEGPMDPCVFREWTYKSGHSNDDVTISVPTFIFNGDDQLNAQDLGSFDASLYEHHYIHKNKLLTVMTRWKDQDTVAIYLPQDPKKTKQNDIEAGVWLIRYTNMQIEKIDTGLNAGKVLRFSNVIQNIKHVGKWYGDLREIDVDVPKPLGGKESGGYAVIVSELMGSPLLAAGQLTDYKVETPATPPSTSTHAPAAATP